MYTIAFPFTSVLTSNSYVIGNILAFLLKPVERLYMYVFGFRKLNNVYHETASANSFVFFYGRAPYIPGLN